MKDKSRLLTFLTLLILPIMVFASDGNDIGSIFEAIFVEGFVTIHMSLFVLKPLANIISKDDGKKTFWMLFVIRIVILLFCDFFVTTNIMFIDIAILFIGAFTLVPISAVVNKKRGSLILNRGTFFSPSTTSISNQVAGIELRCAKCNNMLKVTDKFCTNCGAPIEGDNIVVKENTDASVNVPIKQAVLQTDFDSIYSLTEDKMVEAFLAKELTKAGIDKTAKLIPSDILKRKKILNIIFSLLVFVFITIIFFHFPIYTYLIGIVLLFIFFKVTRRYNLIKYLKKQLKARPSEKITNIVMNVKTTFTEDNSKGLFAFCLLIAIVAPLIIFSSPRIIYEKEDNGYAVRYYIFGLTNFKTATIPETYNGEKVVSLRGNTFSNMPFLESVILPDSITEIRGQAFLNCLSLKEVNIPKKLEYLGGGAFYNAVSIKRVELPDTLTELGGEAFYGASSLEYVKLSKNLTEIRGDSFELCTSLKSIAIPDNVTRIGGHAFYGDESLSEVSFSSNSQLIEIGSSAFRNCFSLNEITIPEATYVNERAFKNSPTYIYRFGKSSAEILTNDVINNLEEDYSYFIETNLEKDKLFVMNNELTFKYYNYNDLSGEYNISVVGIDECNSDICSSCEDVSCLDNSRSISIVASGFQVINDKYMIKYINGNNDVLNIVIYYN